MWGYIHSELVLLDEFVLFVETEDVFVDVFSNIECLDGNFVVSNVLQGHRVELARVYLVWLGRAEVGAAHPAEEGGEEVLRGLILNLKSNC